MRRPALFVALLAVLALAVFASSVEPSSAQSTTIDAGNFYFCSASFENGVCDNSVTAGSTVTWQVSAGFHTVTQCDASFTTCPPGGGFDSGQLSSGGTFAQTFNTPGTVSYYCAFHPTQMRGRILVQAQPTVTSPPTATPGPGQTVVPTPGATSTPGVTSGPAQVPAGGGSAGSTSPWATVIVAVGVILLGSLIGAGALSVVRRRAHGGEY